jgi:6-phosphogluconolactonase
MRVDTLLILGLATISAGPLFARERNPTAFRVYIGTYTGPQSKGIYTARLDLASGALTDVEVAAEETNPSFLAIHPSGKFVYAVGEIANANPGGKPAGAVHAYAVQPDGKLKRLNVESSQGAGPCHIVVDKSGKFALVANYGGGSVASLPILEDGTLGSAVSAIQHEGSSVNPQRQKEPHAHSINVDPSNHYVFAADLGLDKVLIYRLDGHGKLTPNEPPYAKVAPGAGPRHFAFHPSGKFAWVINELGNTVTGFSFDANKGSLTEIESMTTLPKDVTDKSYTAEVVVHPSGKFLYGSNRGHDSLAIFKIDQDTGKLTPAGHQPTGGKTPRNFAIEPTGQYLLAENQASGTTVVFRIDGNTGALKQVGEPVAVPSPVCVRFLATQ